MGSFSFTARQKPCMRRLSHFLSLTFASVLRLRGYKPLKGPCCQLSGFSRGLRLYEDVISHCASPRQGPWLPSSSLSHLDGQRTRNHCLPLQHDREMLGHFDRDSKGDYGVYRWVKTALESLCLWALCSTTCSCVSWMTRNIGSTRRWVCWHLGLIPVAA